VLEGDKRVASGFTFLVLNKSDPFNRSTKIKLFAESVLSGGIGKSSNEDGLVGISVGDVFVLKGLPYNLR